MQKKEIDPRTALKGMVVLDVQNYNAMVRVWNIWWSKKEGARREFVRQPNRK